MIGDLGTTPTEVETKLGLSFTLAHRWGCVLLLDEADVFLVERGKEDFKRNSLVSGMAILSAALSRFTTDFLFSTLNWHRRSLVSPVELFADLFFVF